MQEFTINPKTTALILIDLQKGIVRRPVQPYDSSIVVEHAHQLAELCRKSGATVVLVHVSYSTDGKDRLTPIMDAAPLSGKLPDDFDQIVPEVGPEKGDIVITKRQWGAFYGTGLELQLRRRKIETILLGGIATNFGVESTARDAYERGYNQIFVEDAMAGLSTEAHEFVIKNIFPRIGKVKSTEEVINAFPGK